MIWTLSPLLQFNINFSLEIAANHTIFINKVNLLNAKIIDLVKLLNAKISDLVNLFNANTIEEEGILQNLHAKKMPGLGGFDVTFPLYLKYLIYQSW